MEAKFDRTWQINRSKSGSLLGCCGRDGGRISLAVAGVLRDCALLIDFPVSIWRLSCDDWLYKGRLGYLIFQDPMEMLLSLDFLAGWFTMASSSRISICFVQVSFCIASWAIES